MNVLIRISLFLFLLVSSSCTVTKPRPFQTNVPKENFTEAVDLESCSDPKKQPEFLNLEEAIFEAGAPQYRSNRKINGEVVLHMLIDSSGTIQAVNVIDSPHSAFTEHLMDAAENLKIKPGLCGGENVSMWTELSYEYSFGFDNGF